MLGDIYDVLADILKDMDVGDKNIVYLQLSPTSMKPNEYWAIQNEMDSNNFRTVIQKAQTGLCNGWWKLRKD